MGILNLPHSSRLAGILTRAELAAAGVTDATIRSMVRRGQLTILTRGVYAPGIQLAKLGDSDRAERRLQVASALALLGPSSVASHQEAAAIHQLALLGQLPRRITVSRPLGVAASRSGRPWVSLHNLALPGGHVTVVGQVPVTTVARTVVDIARVTSFRSGVVTADSALHQGRTTEDELIAVVAACSRWPGVDRAREVVEFSDGRSESPLESISRVAFREGGLPPPDLQVSVRGGDGLIYRVDFLWRRYRTVGEADGALKYQKLGRVQSQLLRDRALRDAGFEVVHFSWKEIMATPGVVVDSVRAAFHRAAALRDAQGGS